MPNIRIPFDSLVLEAVVEELQSFVGGRVQGVRQPDETSVGICLYGGGREAWLLLCCHPEFARVHLTSKRPENQPAPPALCSALRARIDGGSLISARQVSGDRILDLAFETSEGVHVLVAELMGKHSNLILLEEPDRVVAAAKWVGGSKSSRPILPGRAYERPPTFAEGAISQSPFLKRLLEAGGSTERPFHPVLSPGHGAYPVSVASLGLVEHPRASISVALETHFEAAIREHEVRALRTNLTSQLNRVLLARETALTDLRQALDQGERAGRTQRMGELILAYGPSSAPGTTAISAWDYDGSEISIKVDPELDFKANANLYFEKAKRAKTRLGLVRDQIERMEAEASAVESIVYRVEQAERLDQLRDLREEANGKRWLNQQIGLAAKPKEERPYEGHRVRELLGPGGYRVLYGETAEANDYLTARVAKPNDWWLHIRGATSAHVVIQTGSHPEKVGKETLAFAAKVAVQNSPSKHSGFVAVDYTLKKYVRKPRGAPKGTALYTHEKTLHVD
jgi:predicted ribosome quality control (RQC) complex YloA/Tae2 family protein